MQTLTDLDGYCLGLRCNHASDGSCESPDASLSLSLDRSKLTANYRSALRPLAYLAMSTSPKTRAKVIVATVTTSITASTSSASLE